MHRRPLHHDTRALFYQMGKQLVFIVAAVLLVKFFVLDVVTMRGDQMAPPIRNGDRLLLLRLPYFPLVHAFPGLGRHQPVVFAMPFEKTLGCLRVAAIGGDTASVENGVFRNSASSMRRYPRAAPPGQNSTVMPAQYSPRDFVEAACVPGKGERINLDSLTPYGFFFATTAIRQENPSSVFSMQPHLFLNDTLSTDYFIADFALYKGPLDSVPAVCRYDWFFWKRLAEYIRLTETDRSVKLSFTLYQDNARIGSYVFREQFLFLLADNWDKGYDSRYFGPVAESRVFGRPFLVLWSFRRTADGGTGFSIRRLGRILW